jgi:hypothetical protein
MSSGETPHPDAGGQDGDRAEQPKIVVDDPEDFAKTRQLRAIFDARDDYIEARRDANRLYEDDELSFTDRNRRIFRHLQDFAMTMEPLLKSYESGREIWKNNTYSVDANLVAASELPSFDEAWKELNNIAEVTDPGGTPATDAGRLIVQYKKEKAKSNFSRNLETLEPQIREFATSWGWKVEGLGELIKRTHKLKFRTKHGRKDFATTAPVQETSDTAFRDLQDFIREIGLGVQFDTTQQTKIDDDLLEEVDAWRQQNVN